ncbi:hypothetical protein MPTK1_2g10090 [Marchantia polymorpha subsp. ruderalis]
MLMPLLRARETQRSGEIMGLPIMLEFVDAVFKRLHLWVRTCVYVAAVIAEALHNGDSSPYHVT